MRQFVRAQRGQAAEPTPLDQAHEILLHAYQERDEQRRVELAKEALETCPDCADAYVLLAEHAPSRKQALGLYEQGVAAGERALGPEPFRTGVGRFWGLLETRPYMRAQLGLAHALWTAGRRDEAVRHLQEMTGVGYPQLSAVIECADAGHGNQGHICSDGGCRVPGDVAKAFGAGADFVMLGGMLAGTEECEGQWATDDGGKRSMKFYGMSSREAQVKHQGGVKDYCAAEGKCVEVAHKGSAREVLQEVTGGLRSACAYTGAARLKDLCKCCTFVRCTRTSNALFDWPSRMARTARSAPSGRGSRGVGRGEDEYGGPSFHGSRVAGPHRPEADADRPGGEGEGAQGAAFRLHLLPPHPARASVSLAFDLAFAGFDVQTLPGRGGNRL
jgi:IMP dehydrogenase/GMP reductase